MFLKRIRPYLILLAVVAAVIIADRWLLAGEISGLMRLVFSPVTSRVSRASIAIKKRVIYFTSVNQIIKENESLKNRLALSIVDEAKIFSLERELELLRNKNHIQSDQPSQLLAAKIINIMRSGVSSGILVDKGRRDGIEEGMPVVTADNIAVGLVETVSSRTSYVRLVDDPLAVTAVRIAGEDVLATVKGRSNGDLDVDLIGIQENAKNGAALITSGFDHYPAGLFAGSIDLVDVRRGNLFQTIKAKMAYDLSLSPTVYIDIK